MIVVDMSRIRRVPPYIQPVDFGKFYRGVASQLRHMYCADTPQLKVLAQYKIPLFRKLSRGNQRPPHRVDELWVRMASVLRRLVQNPCGVKSIKKGYLRRSRGDDLRPPRTVSAGGAFFRRALRLLKDKDLVASHPKGYYTTQKGKKLLLSHLDDGTPS